MRRTVLALILAAGGCGGTTYQGVVRDGVTGEALPGARVAIGEEVATTDELGFYELSVSDETMPHAVRVAASGYVAEAEHVIVGGDEDWAILSYDLRPVDAPPASASVAPASTRTTTVPAGAEREEPAAEPQPEDPAGE